MGNHAKAFLKGRVISEPKTMKTRDGKTILRFPVACRTMTKDEDNKYYVDDVYSIVAFGWLAEHNAQLIEKGTDVNVFGDLKKVEYETKNHEKKQDIEVNASDIMINTGKKSAPSRQDDDDFMP